MWWSRWPVRRRALVNLHDGSAFDGVLYRKSGPLLELRDVTYMETGHEPAQLDGAVLVERVNVAFIQVR